MTNGKITAEYIWLDGRKPTAKLRSKTKIINGPIRRLEDIPMWGFDGSSTEQAEGHFSDCQLKPVYYVPDPIGKGDNILVMCEVLNADGTPHISNTRHILADVAEKYKDQDPWFGIEQEYTLYGKNDWPYGWPPHGFPHPGPLLLWRRLRRSPRQTAGGSALKSLFGRRTGNFRH